MDSAFGGGPRRETSSIQSRSGPQHSGLSKVATKVDLDLVHVCMDREQLGTARDGVSEIIIRSN